MAHDLNPSVFYTVVAPANSGGFGGTAVLNNTASSDYVGDLWEFTRNVTIRPNKENITEGNGAVFGASYAGEMTGTLKVKLGIASTWALSNARHDKLLRATDALSSDGTITWTETGGVAKRILFRTEQRPTDPDETGFVIFGWSSADDRIYADTATTGSSPTTNAGTASSPPTFTLTPTGSNVVITNSTTGLALTLTVGAEGVSTGSAVTVDFKARSVTQGGTRKDYAVVYPTSTWWEIIPGSNTWSVSNASSVSISVRSAWP